MTKLEGIISRELPMKDYIKLPTSDRDCRFIDALKVMLEENFANNCEQLSYKRIKDLACKHTGANKRRRVSGNNEEADELVQLV